MASGFAVLMVIVGVLLAVLGFQTISDCSSRFTYVDCWNPFVQPPTRDYSLGIFAFVFYFGSVMVALGATILMGRSITRMVGKLRGT